MKIKITMTNLNEQDLLLRIETGISAYVNWLQLKHNKADISCEETEDGLIIEGDSKYEKAILEIIENAKNGAYDEM